jgi:hypothetical protein
VKRVELLWIRDVEKRPVKLPVALLSAAPLSILVPWRKRNSFLDNVPITMFGGLDLAPLGDVFCEVSTNGVPYRCENAPAKSREFFAALREHEDPNPWSRYLAACEHVAQNVAPLGEPVWVVGADADDGLLAVTAAKARGGKVAAIAGGSIGAIGASLAAQLCVDVAVTEHDNRRVVSL